jgi:hypothetical protein
MEGGTGLRSWEKAYWGVFVVAIALFLFNRLPGKEVEVEDPKVRLVHGHATQSAIQCVLWQTAIAVHRSHFL